MSLIPLFTVSNTVHFQLKFSAEIMLKCSTVYCYYTGLILLITYNNITGITVAMDLLQSSCVGVHMGVGDCAVAKLCYGRSKRESMARERL